jgi:murein DD-endopeptidase MepM/ murein hydrolase activator NlpD
MIRSIAVGVLALATVGSPAGRSAARLPVLGPAPKPVSYQAPVPAPVRVLRGFDPPADPYGPGHLGVDLSAGRQAVVRAAGPGVVRFAGPVAGRGVVVIEHPDGIRTEYEPVQPQVEVGAAVRAGDPIGHIAGRHRGCAPRSCLHWGARRGDTYLDPMALLGRLGPVRLLPWPRDG